MKPFLIKNKIFIDSRGCLSELFIEKKIKIKFKFTIFSSSKKNVIRGLHYQIKKPQGKFITLLKGKAIDIAVNINKKSRSFGKIYKFILKPGLGLYVPCDYAHGIGFYEKENILLYHLTEYRYPEFERGIKYNDKKLNINWKINKPLLSKRDKNHPSFEEI